MVDVDRYYHLDGLMLKIKRQLRQPEGYPFDLSALERLLQDAIEGRFEEAALEQPTAPTITGYKLAIDRTRTWAEWQQATGIAARQWNDNITELHFPITVGEGDEQVEVVTIHFDRVMTTAEVRRYREEHGLEPVEFVHQMAMAEAHPELQTQFPLLNFDSAWVDGDGHWHVLVLDEHIGRGLDLCLDYIGNRWSHDCRFLALAPPGWTPPEGVEVIYHQAVAA